MIEHNHITRDIKPIGKCPGCDDRHHCTCPHVWIGMKKGPRNLSPNCDVHREQEAEAVRRLGFEP